MHVDQCWAGLIVVMSFRAVGVDYNVSAFVSRRNGDAFICYTWDEPLHKKSRYPLNRQKNGTKK